MRIMRKHLLKNSQIQQEQKSVKYKLIYISNKYEKCIQIYMYYIVFSNKHSITVIYYKSKLFVYNPITFLIMYF